MAIGIGNVSAAAIAGVTMALGKRKTEQQELWIATTDLPKSPGHPFYRKLNQVLAEAKFDTWLEKLCAPYYHAVMGRPSIPPGVYFRMILVGYFEGIASQRGIAWRCSDSRSLADFLGLGCRALVHKAKQVGTRHSLGEQFILDGQPVNG